MKSSPSLSRHFRLLALAGVVAAPMAFAVSDAPPAMASDEGSMYDNARYVQSQWNEDSMYSNLRYIQSQWKPGNSIHGAQGPVRDDFSAPSSSYDEGATYDNLRKHQESTSTSQ